MSEVLAQFLLYPSLIHSRVSKELLDKVQYLEDSREMMFPNFSASWADLSEEEKKTMLTIPHERMHYYDITSLPVGMLLWRLNRMDSDYSEFALTVINRLGLADDVTFPLTDWLKNGGLAKLKANALSVGGDVIFMYQDLEQWIIHDKEIYEQFEKDLLFNTDPVASNETIKLYNQTYRGLKAFFGFPCRAIWRKSTYEYPMIPQDHELALNLYEMFEVRAHIREALGAGILRSKGEIKWWLDNMPSGKGRNFLKVMTDNEISSVVIFEMTALAMSPAIDPISAWAKTKRYLTLENEHPALRLRRIVYGLLSDHRDLFDPTIAFMKQLDDAYDPASEEIRWAEFGEKLFNYSTLPYSLMAGARRGVMFGGEAQPVFVPFQTMVEHPTRMPQYLAATVFDDPTALFDKRAQNERIKQSFLANHAGMAAPYVGMAYAGRFAPPYCEIYQDQIHFFDSRLMPDFVFSQNPKQDEANMRVIMADVLSSLCLFSRYLFARGCFENGQCWDLDEILDHIKIAGVIGTTEFIRSCLTMVFGEQLVNKMVFTSPPF